MNTLPAPQNRPRHKGWPSCRKTRRPGFHVTALAVALACASMPANAIVLNDRAAALLPGAGSLNGGLHDWFDQDNRHSNVVSLYLPVVGSMCTGTLLNHRTVLTAAHCFPEGAASVLRPVLGLASVRFNPDAREPSPHDRGASGMLLHSGFAPASDGAHPNDIAVLSLKAPVTGVKPVILHQSHHPAPLQGSQVHITGYGNYGAGSGKLRDDSRRRAGDTTIFLAPGNAYNQGLILIKFRAPASGGDLPWLAHPASGDSGGPLFMTQADGSLVQIGVLSAGDDGLGTTASYVPVLSNKAWIDANNPLHYVTAGSGTWKWSTAQAWEDANASPDAMPVAPYNQEGSLTFARLGRYYEVNISGNAQITVDTSPAIDRLMLAGESAELVIPGKKRVGVVLDTLIQQGHLRVDGVLSTGEFAGAYAGSGAPGLLQTGGRISGAGKIIAGGGFTQNGGVIAPGGATFPGVLRIDGDFTQRDGGTLAVRVHAQDGADMLKVTGKASISGKLDVNILGKAPAVGQRFTVLRAGEIEGDFAEITSSLPAFTWTTQAERKDIILSAAGVDYGQVLAGDGQNSGARSQTERYLSARSAIQPLNQLARQIAPAEALALADSIPIGDVPFPSTPALAVASLNTMDRGALGLALLVLPPSGFHAQTGFGIVTSRLAAAAIFERLGSLDGDAGTSGLNATNGSVDAQTAPFALNAARKRQAELLPGYAGGIGAVAPLAPTVAPTPFGLFISASYLTGGANTAFPYTAGSVTAGLDYRVSPEFTFGAALTHIEDTRAANGEKLVGHAVAPTLYGRFAMNRIFVDGYAAYAFADGKSRRIIPFGDETLTAVASPRSGQFMAGAVAGVKLDGTVTGTDWALPAGLSLTPFLGFDVAQMNLNGYIERGAGALAIAVAPRQFTDARVSAGFELAWDLPMAGGVLTPRLKTSVTRRVGDRIDNADAFYVIAPDLPFRLTGHANTGAYGTLGASLGFRINEAFSAQIAYQADVSNGGFHDNRLTTKAQVRF